MAKLDFIDVNASTSGNGGNEHPVGTLLDPLGDQVQFRAQELVVDQVREEQERNIGGALSGGSSFRGGDDVIGEKRESVSGGFDLGTKTEDGEGRTDDNEKLPVGSGAVLMGNQMESMAEKASVRLCGKVAVDKEVEEKEEDNCDALKREMDESRGVNPSDDAKDSDDRLRCEDSCIRRHVSEDGNADGSTKQDMDDGAKVENTKNLMDVGFVERGLELPESKNKTVPDDVNRARDGRPTFDDSDLVWAKVRSHPWWPGQIFDASAASEKAKKYFKKGSFLVTYFGDYTFAWNDVSRIKPFWQHFLQMERQSKLAEFRNAIECALEEVSRRIEFSLACPCVSEGVYNKIKTQTIINPGICKDFCKRPRQGSSSANSFAPTRFVEYIRSLACSSDYHLIDKLKFVTQRAQLLAFYRWKGYAELPGFETLHGSLESALGKSTQEGKSKKMSEMTTVREPKTVEPVLPSKRKNTEENDDSGEKPNRRLKHESEDKTAQSRTEKTLSEFIAEKSLSKNIVNRSDGKFGGGKLVSDKKRKIGHSESESYAVKIQKNNLQTEDSMALQSAKNDRKDQCSAGNVHNLQTARPVFRVGASILKVASLMNSAGPIILKPWNGSSKKMLCSNKNKEKSLQMEISSPEEFRKESSRGNTQEESAKLGILESMDVEDTTEEQLLPETKKETADLVPEIPTVTGKPTGRHSPGGDCSDYSCKDDDFSEDEHSSTPNALILKFADLGSVPSEETLNNIFSRYGPLRESETEVLKKSNRAKVVFRRGEDAEAAFSSAGKYSIFGPSLLSYRLSYVASKPSKSRKPSSRKTINPASGNAL